MTKIKKTLVILVFLILSISNIYANNNVRLGLGIGFETEILSKENKGYYSVMHNDFNNIDKIMHTGLNLDFSYLPFGTWWGIGTKLNLFLPTGYIIDNDTNDFINRNLNIKIVTELNTYFEWLFFNHAGLDLSLGCKYTYTQIATTNKKNNKEKVDYLNYQDFLLTGSLGAIVITENNYFNFIFTYSHSLKNNTQDTSFTVTMGLYV